MPLVISVLFLVLLPGKGKPVADQDLKPPRVELAPADNAFFVLQEGAKRLQWPQENRPQIAGMAEGNPRWRWSNELAEDLLARNQGFMQVIEKTLALGRLQVPTPGTIDEDHSYLSGWGGIAMLASIRSAMLLREGHEEEALQLACRLLDLGRLYENAGGLDSHYRRGWTTKRTGLTRLRQLVSETTLPVERWKAVLKRLNSDGADQSALTNVFKNMYQVQARLVDDLSEGKLPGTNEGGRITRAIGSTIGLPMLNVGATKELFAESARVGLKGIPHHYAEMPLSELPQLPESSSALRKVMRGNALGELMWGLEEPTIGGMLAQKCRENAIVSGTQLVIALRCYQLQHGSLPQALDALVPDYLERVPVDDFDGKPFRYSRAKRIVYSVDRDLVDDGGRPYEAGKQTQDLVFELGF